MCCLFGYDVALWSKSRGYSFRRYKMPSNSGQKWDNAEECQILWYSKCVLCYLSWSSCPSNDLSYFPLPPPWLTIPTLPQLLYKQSLPSWAQFYPDDGECTFVRDISTHLPDYTDVKQNSNEMSPPSAATNLSSPLRYAPRRSVGVYPTISKNITNAQSKKNK